METLNARQYGSGEPLVFLGSLGANAHFWAPQIDAFFGQRRCIAIDHPGHGDSPLLDVSTIADFASATLATLDALGVDSFDIVGLSLGGAVAQHLAATSGRVHRAALLSTNAQFGTAESWTTKAQFVRAGGPHEANAATITNWFTQNWRDQNPAKLDFVLSAMDSTPPEGYARACEALAAWNNWDNLGDIRVPTLLAPGGHDAGCTPDVMSRMAERIPKSTYTVIESAAHLSNVEAEEEVTALLARHFGLLV